MTAVAVVFWVCAGLLVYAQAGYRCCSRVLGACAAARGDARRRRRDGAEPTVSLIVAAHARRP